MTGRYLIRILLFAAAVRLALLAAAWNHPQRVLAPDSPGYVQLAESLATDNAFQLDGQPEILRTPGYPLFLIPSFAFRASYSRVAIVVQILLDVLLVYLTYLLASMLASRQAALWAAAFQAISAVAIVSSVQILSDGLYALLLTLATCLMVVHLKAGKWWSLLSAAGVLAAACYVRPAGVVMAAAFAAILLARPKRFRFAGAFLGVVLAAIAPWTVRNYVNARYVGFSSFAGDAMYFFAVPELRSRLEDADPAAMRARLKARASPVRDEKGAFPPPGPAAAERHRKALEIIAEHPLTYAGLHFKGCLGTYLPGEPAVLELTGLTAGQRGTSDVLRKEGPLAAARHYFGDNLPAIVLAIPMVLLLAAKYLTASFCVIKKARLRMPAEAWLLLVIVIVSTLLPGPFGLPRYRTPFEPLLSVAAGAGVTAVINAVRRRRAVQ